MWSSMAAGSGMCSIVCRNTTQSTSPRHSSTMLRSKETVWVVYFARACANASGLASTPTTRAGGDPLVDRQVAAEPVVLLGDVGQRPLARQVQGRDAGGLVALDVE